MIEQVMCRACGEFVQALPEDDGLVPLREACPRCGEAEFKHNGSGEIIRTDG